MTFTKPYNEDLVTSFNNAWQRNEAIPRLNAATQMANARMSDQNIRSLANLSSTAGQWALEIDEKQQAARAAEAHLDVFFNQVYGKVPIEHILAAKEQDDIFVKALDEENLTEAEFDLKQGASFEQVHDNRLARGVKM